MCAIVYKKYVEFGCNIVIQTTQTIERDDSSVFISPPRGPETGNPPPMRASLWAGPAPPNRAGI